MVLNNVFCDGHSPERIYPGDKVHTLESIVKLISGSNEESSILINRLYKKIIPAGTCRLPGIREAEAAKVIENVQRDVNIALGFKLKGDCPDLRNTKVIILAVKHDVFIQAGIKNIRNRCKPGCFVFDVKRLFEAGETDGRL